MVNQELKEKYAVPTKTVNNIFSKIIAKQIGFITPSIDPVNVIVGGQPGSGKSQLLNLALHDFNNNIFIANLDDFKKFHPQVEQIKRLHERNYSDLTAQFANDIMNLAVKECRNLKINFAVEATMKGAEGINKLISDSKDYGFTVNIDLLAVNYSWSALGIFERYEAEKLSTTFGRVIPLEGHDLRYNSMVSAVKEIQKAGLYDNLRIFGRGLVKIHNVIKQQVILVSKDSTNAHADLIQERNRSKTPQEEIYFNKEFSRVLQMMANRKASPEAVSNFKAAFRNEELVNEKSR